MRLYPLAGESDLTEAKSAAPLSFRDDSAKSLFHQGFQCGPLSMGQLTCLLKQAVRYVYGCFHTADHITAYTKPSTARDLNA